MAFPSPCGECVRCKNQPLTRAPVIGSFPSPCGECVRCKKQIPDWLFVKPRLCFRPLAGNVFVARGSFYGEDPSYAGFRPLAGNVFVARWEMGNCLLWTVSFRPLAGNVFVASDV